MRLGREQSMGVVDEQILAAAERTDRPEESDPASRNADDPGRSSHPSQPSEEEVLLQAR